MDIVPTKQTITDVFSSTNYHIDFYQREYKWEDEQVELLIDDLFYVFDDAYPQFSERDASKQTISEFPWYYLSTYVTHKSEGKTYVVDGQQRLTTLTLMLIKLHELARMHELDARLKWLDGHIVGHSATGKNFWIGHGKREEPLRSIYEGDLDALDDVENITSENMRDNYDTISSRLDAELEDAHRCEMFVLFFLLKTTMIQLEVQQQTDVPMVFEVINDRGVGLESHEILKGKLLAEIDKSEVAPYTSQWEEVVGRIDYEYDADDFFGTYFQSKFADTRPEGQELAGDRYHRVVFDPKETYAENLGFTTRENTDTSVTNAVKDFVKGDLSYYAYLYELVRGKEITTRGADFDPEYAHVCYNGLTDMSTQRMLVLAACERNDPEEKEKINTVAQELDRLYVLLQLNNAYDSNDFNDAIFDIRGKLRGSSVDEYRDIFEDVLFEQIEKHRGVTVEVPLPERFFKRVGYEDLNSRFMRYFFMRIDEFIANGIGKNLSDDRYNLVRNSGSKNGYHIEHILAQNEQSQEVFNGDEERFEQQRHRLGALLLLNRRDNISSSNEPFEDKKDTYVATLYWNQMLRHDFVSNNPNHRDFVEGHELKVGFDEFNPEVIERRTKDLYRLTTEIWDC